MVNPWQWGFQCLILEFKFETRNCKHSEPKRKEKKKKVQAHRNINVNVWSILESQWTYKKVCNYRCITKFSKNTCTRVFMFHKYSEYKHKSPVYFNIRWNNNGYFKKNGNALLSTRIDIVLPNLTICMNETEHTWLISYQ